MNRTAQSLLITLVGGALLWISLFTDAYLNYVKPGFRPFLIAAGVCLVALGLIGAYKEWRGEHAHDDDDGCHGGGGGRVAWLLCVPVLAIFLIAPPALGSFTASKGNGLVSVAPKSELKTPQNGGPAELKIWEFVSRAYQPKFGSVKDRKVKLTGFVVPSAKEKGWLVARLMVGCCAADANSSSVLIRNHPQPAAKSWVTIEGTWIPPKSGKKLEEPDFPEFAVTKVTPIPQPKQPYETV